MMLFTEKIFLRIFLFGHYLLLSAIFSGVVNAVVNQDDYRYVINADFSHKKSHINFKRFSKRYSVYQIKIKNRYRTRIGFFKSRRKALKILKKVKKSNSSAWLDTVKSYDKKYRRVWYKRKQKLSSKGAKRKSFRLKKKQMLSLMDKARKLMVDHNYPAAIKIYNKVLSRGSVAFRQDAQEYLGVAREKNGQYAHAKAEYREYLRRYPKGEGAERVRMRLNGILTARKGPRRRMKKARGNRKAIWVTYGYLTEFYRYDKLDINNSTIEKSSMTTSLGLFARRKGDSSDLKLQMTGSHLYDLDDSEDNRRRLTSLYIDYANRPKTTSVRIGRQNHIRSGVLGRMDGIWADYQLKFRSSK